MISAMTFFRSFLFSGSFIGNNRDNLPKFGIDNDGFWYESASFRGIDRLLDNLWDLCPAFSAYIDDDCTAFESLDNSDACAGGKRAVGILVRVEENELSIAGLSVIPGLLQLVDFIDVTGNIEGSCG